MINREMYERISEGFETEAARSRSIHADCYREAQFLSIEQREIFAKSWQFLCHEERLGDVGNFVTADIQGQSVFAVRCDDGELRAFYNVCKHRGHELLDGCGKVRTIVCPYHSWAYNLDGTLRRARRTEHVQDFNPKDIRLSSIQVEVFCNLVFLNLDPTAAPLAKQSGDLACEINEYAPDLGSLTFAHRLEYRIKANWKAVVDNFLECYHCPTAHRDFCTLVEMDTYKVRTHGIYSSHMAKAGRDTQNNAYAVDAVSVTDHAVWYLWPNTTLMRYPGCGNFMVWRFYPTGIDETYEVFDFFFETADPTTAQIEAIKFIDEVLQPEDIALVESVQRGMRTPAFEQGRYVIDPEGSGLSEHAVHHFHALVLDAYRRELAGKASAGAE